MAALLALSIIVCPVLYFAVGPTLDATQLETLKILGIIAACSAAFCFIVGEASGIKVSEQEFTCPGAMGPIKAGHPDAADIENFKAFVKSVIGK